MSFAAALLIGLTVDALIGWPDRLYARIGHPVTWLGALISALDARLNTGTARQRRLKGAAATLATVAAATLPALALQSALPAGALGLLLAGLLAWPLIAARSLHDHVAAVARPLLRGETAAARRAVAMIVGRDPDKLDCAGIARAALESLAENTSDGITAPLFWGCIGGLPGIAAYKAINTLDSMIGHRNERFEEFGKAAARLDDVVNWLPARLTGALFALAAGPKAAPNALTAMRRDARKHRSPNAGWPESALAGALGIRLSGPRLYGSHIADEPWLNATAPDPAPQDMSRGLALYRRTIALCALALGLLALL